ncbi:dephospho-CoA kinase [Atopobium fossor]|uniref:dephospho-CoA kinase n=1 Tax=Atopobium fossor TaxID=39487 RepID=UPI00040BAD67|nr:dephospho-CoA kinase [Atopobium fossor]
MYKPLYIVFLVGGIASGKSSVSRQLASLGAQIIDLDQLSRHVLDINEQLKDNIARAFGEDVLDDKTGRIDRALLAHRAFDSTASTALLEKLELPVIKAELMQRLKQAQTYAMSVPPVAMTISGTPVCAARICVVEVPLLDRMEEFLNLADEVLLIDTPVELRCKRALERGMSEKDFWARASKQADDQWLRVHADTIVVNTSSEDALTSAIALWWKERLDVVS